VGRSFRQLGAAVAGQLSRSPVAVNLLEAGAVHHRGGESSTDVNIVSTPWNVPSIFEVTSPVPSVLARPPPCPRLRCLTIGSPRRHVPTSDRQPAKRHVVTVGVLAPISEARRNRL